MQTMSPERPSPVGSPSRALRNRAWRLPEVNCYQVTIAAVSIFAIAMELMFPPSRITLANGSSVYAGHYVSADALLNVQVDYVCLALELVAILAVAAVGWRLAENR